MVVLGVDPAAKAGDTPRTAPPTVIEPVRTVLVTHAAMPAGFIRSVRPLPTKCHKRRLHEDTKIPRERP